MSTEPWPQNKLLELPFSTYLEADAINASGLKHIIRSPAHYQASLTEPPPETDALRFGKLLHLAVLEPERYAALARPCPKFDKRTKAGKADLAAWAESLTDDCIEVPEAWHGKIQRMSDKVHAHTMAARLLARGTRESSFFWTDPATSVLCKARPDFVSQSNILVDLKTTTDARIDPFSRAIWEYRYDIQAAHYCAGAAATGLARSDQYAFLVLEKDPPHEVAVYVASDTVIGVGTQWRRDAMAVYARCRSTGVWPGYPQRAEIIGLPPWAKGAGEDE